MTPARKIIAFLLFFLSPSCIAAQPLPQDLPVTAGKVEAACTGASLDAREDPRWPAYSLKLEFAGEGGRYLGGESVTVRKQGRKIFSGSCNGPWLLLRLSAGYEVLASLDGNTISTSVLVPATGRHASYCAFRKCRASPEQEKN